MFATAPPSEFRTLNSYALLNPEPFHVPRLRAESGISSLRKRARPLPRPAIATAEDAWHDGFPSQFLKQSSLDRERFRREIPNHVCKVIRRERPAQIVLQPLDEADLPKGQLILPHPFQTVLSEMAAVPATARRAEFRSFVATDPREC